MKRNRSAGAFTLLELMTVMVVIAILAVLAIQAFAFLLEKAQRVSCASNLTSLFAASSAYVVDHQSWPQIPTADLGAPYAQAWSDALTPYKIGKINWICPSVQKLLNNPDYIQPANLRVDYFATPFDSVVSSPYRYSTQPWFIERASIHGDGNLMIFSNGAVRSLNDLLNNPPAPSQ